jgi:hypothetical protein
VVRRLAPGDTGPSGKLGFNKPCHACLIEEEFAGYTHSDVFGYEHYSEFWLPFLNRLAPYEGETEPPAYAEEPVSPYDAARWSAMTYFHQYVKRVTDAISAGEAFAGNPETPLPAKQLVVIIPSTP